MEEETGSEEIWKCVRLILDRRKEKGVVRIDTPTYEQLLGENVGFEDFVEAIKIDVDAGIIYDDSENEIGGIVVLYIPFGEITVDSRALTPLCEHGEPVRCFHGDRANNALALDEAEARLVGRQP